MYDNEILAIKLENLDHFIDVDLINKLDENYIPVEYSYLFKNIQMTKLGDKSKLFLMIKLYPNSNLIIL